MKPKLKIDNDRASVHGPLTIKHHKELMRIVKKLAESNVTTITVDKPEEIDLCAIQIFWSLLILKKKNTDSTAFVFNLNEADSALLKRCGFQFLLTPPTT